MRVVKTSAGEARGSAVTAERSDRARIVIADDNEDLLQMLAWFLEGEGFEVHSALDGHEAVRLAEQHRPDVMILDLGMPGVDGYEAARTVRARPWGDATKLVAHSGYGRREDKHRALEAGFDVHLTKPVDPRELVRLIETFCDATPS